MFHDAYLAHMPEEMSSFGRTRVAAMNARHDLTSFPSSALAVSLAESALRLRGPDVRTFVEQFLSHATKPSVVRVTGDGKVFRQALCFPVSGMAAERDTVMPFPGLPPHLLVELGSGHVIGFRINDSTPSRLSLTAFMQDIERYQDLLAKRDTGSWSGIQQMIEGTQRKRIRFFDFVLDNDPTIFLARVFPPGSYPADQSGTTGAADHRTRTQAGNHNNVRHSLRALPAGLYRFSGSA